MTTKEKAFNLYFKFIYDVVADHEKAKQCALIAVNEILKSHQLYNDYWEEVRKEIQKL